MLFSCPNTFRPSAAAACVAECVEPRGAGKQTCRLRCQLWHSITRFEWSAGTYCPTAAHTSNIRNRQYRGHASVLFQSSIDNTLYHFDSISREGTGWKTFTRNPCEILCRTTATFCCAFLSFTLGCLLARAPSLFYPPFLRGLCNLCHYQLGLFPYYTIFIILSSFLSPTSFSPLPPLRSS